MTTLLFYTVKNSLTANDFPNFHSLINWLHENNIDISAWDTDDAKGLHSLWRELQCGEITLTTPPPQRHVRVVSLLIERENKILMEVSQTMQDGRMRRRNLPPSEKLLADESPLRGTRRCLQEEIGVEGSDVRLTEVGVREAIRESPSYPGLASVYTIHNVSLSLPQLPDSDFTIPNQGVGDSVVAHTWGWRPKESHWYFRC